MAIGSQFEIKCGNCGYWMPAAATGDLMPDMATFVGTVVQCRKCLQRTTCSSNNMRLRVEGGAHA